MADKGRGQVLDPNKQYGQLVGGISPTNTYLPFNTDASGNLATSVAPGAPAPAMYTLNGVDTVVARDTVTPTNSRPFPVEIMSASGVDINITAGDINIQTTDIGANFDSIRIGDGTGAYLNTTQLNTNLDAALSTLATETTLATLATEATALNILSALGGSGNAKVELIRNDYTGTPVTTAAYVQLVASTSTKINHLDIFDSSGQTLVLAVGGAGSEVDQLYVMPGGNGQVNFEIPAASRISVKAVSANATTGELTINCLS